MVATEARLRIGEVARRVGTTPRTIRYYEELGLLHGASGRESGAHRMYTEEDVDRLRETLRLKELLGVSLDELSALVEAEDARAALRDEWQTANPGAARRREILAEALGHIDRQLTLVRRRRQEIDALEQELDAKRRRLKGRLRELGDR
jgi:DNA-binding transcriptional MerR regulator